MLKNKFKMILTLAVVLFIGSSVMAADLGKGNVAVVDVAQIVQKSPQIAAVNQERINKLTELEAFVVSARKDVEAQKTDDAKKALEDKYNKELNAKKNAIDLAYAKKLSQIDTDITALIRIKAKKMGYDLILTKTSVIDGGSDITSDIIKELK